MSLTSDRGFTIEGIAAEYDVDLSDLRKHAIFHTPLLSDADVGFSSALDSADTNMLECAQAPEPRDSIVRKMKLREADILAEVQNEYLITLKNVGRRINKLARVSDIDIEDDDKAFNLSKLLTKPLVDLYIGLGSEIRQTTRTMAELDNLINGEQDGASSGLVALANAIRASRTGDGV